mgnify:CR=1 FL=1
MISGSQRPFRGNDKIFCDGILRKLWTVGCTVVVIVWQIGVESIIQLSVVLCHVLMDGGKIYTKRDMNESHGNPGVFFKKRGSFRINVFTELNGCGFWIEVVPGSACEAQVVRRVFTPGD